MQQVFVQLLQEQRAQGVATAQQLQEISQTTTQATSMLMHGLQSLGGTLQNLAERVMSSPNTVPQYDLTTDDSA